MKIQTLSVLVTALFTSGCASQAINVSRSSNPNRPSIGRIALMPGGGVLAEAVGIQLMSHGFDIIDMSSSTSTTARVDASELELTRPQNLKALAEEHGVDGVLILRSVGGYDGKPSSAAARVINTRTGALLAGVTWQNGKGGAQGSPADNLMRSDLSAAAKKIADGIASALR